MLSSRGGVATAAAIGRRGRGAARPPTGPLSHFLTFSSPFPFSSLPTDIQAEAVPLILGGGDVLAAAETGSGKTGAFALPVLQLVAEARAAGGSAAAAAAGAAGRGPGAAGAPAAAPAAARMSEADRDGLLSVSPDGLAVQARAEAAWAGGRAGVGVLPASRARAWWVATPADDGLARVGAALGGASFDLGSDAGGWGYGGTGRKAHGGEFVPYGGAWGRGDAVGVALDCSSTPPTLSFFRGGAALGPAFTLAGAPPDVPLFPAVYLKNAELGLRFAGPADEPPPGFRWLDALPPAAKATTAPAAATSAAAAAARPPSLPIALVLEPTRDLAEQAAEAFVRLAARLPSIRILCTAGGSPAGPQKAALASGAADVVVGTLGRVQELVATGALSLAGIRVVVLDEADRLVEDGAGRHGVAGLVGSCPKGGAGAARLQVLLFSATLHAPAVVRTAAALCANPIHVDLKGGGGPGAPIPLPEGVDHCLVRVDPRADRSWLQAAPVVPTDGVHAPDAGPGGAPLLSPDADSPEAWSEAVKRLKPRLVARLADALEMGQALLFVRTNHDAACLQAFFDGLAPPGVPPCAGRRPEGAPPPPGAPPHPYSSAVLGGASAMEDRRSALAAFKAGGVRFLIATDVAARGLDVAGLPFVIQVTLPDPDRPEEYVHRIGRVGRAGARGLAVSLLSTVPEKVWFVTRKGYRPWAVPGGVKAADTRPAEDGGHTVWLDEGEALAAIQARLGGVEVPEMGPDLSLPWGPGAGGGGKGGGAGYGGPAGPAAVAAAAAEEEQKARLAALRPAVERLAALETESQRAYFSLRMGGGWGGAEG